MVRNVVINWTNKYSGEKGFVTKVALKEGHICSSPNREDAKVYSENAAKNLLKKLENMGVEQQNHYEIIPV